MSDFNYHNLGIPDFGPGMDGTGKDFGRYAVTGNENDRYRFRTPPLRNVSETAPYFHNGFIQTLEDAIRHHADVDYYSDKYKDDGGFMMRKDQIISITPILKGGLDLTDEDVKDLLSFMKSLTSSLDKETFDRVMPEDVPSGIPIHRLKEETKYLLD
jgi:cytochrome c peroxidase